MSIPYSAGPKGVALSLAHVLSIIAPLGDKPETGLGQAERSSDLWLPCLVLAKPATWLILRQLHTDNTKNDYQ